MTTRTIGVVTVARSDFGIYQPVLHAMARAAELEPKVIAAGMHFAPEFGDTWRDIEAAGFTIDEKIECTLASDSPVGVAKTIGTGVLGFAELFGRWRPDILMVLGDRFEMLAAAVASLPFNIPIAHLHGGESTEGAIDEAIRHAITKMSHLHFVATDEYRRRVVQLGEEPWRVTVSGAPGLDNVLQVEATPRAALEAQLQLPLDQPTLLVTLHPVTRDFTNTDRDAAEVLGALEDCGLQAVITYPNADTHGRRIIALIEAFAATHPRVRLVRNLGQAGYLGLMRHASAMVGNSSSGIIEAASFQLPVVNVGDRQKGRIRGANVIDVSCERAPMAAAIRRAVSPGFRASLEGLVNPYGDGHAAPRIARVLADAPLDRRLIMKAFHDLPEAVS